MTDDALAAIRQRLNDAAPHPDVAFLQHVFRGGRMERAVFLAHAHIDIDALLAHVTVLTAERKEQSGHQLELIDWWQAAIRRREAADADLYALRQQLIRHGRHDGRCPAKDANYGDCTCGFTAALQATAPPQHSEVQEKNEDTRVDGVPGSKQGDLPRHTSTR